MESEGPVICARCENPIESVSERGPRTYILYGGRHYHVECVTGLGPMLCYGCGGMIHPGHAALPASHGVCPACVRVLYPDYADEVLDDGFEAAAETVSGYGRKEN
jgi:hypothetical protein